MCVREMARWLHYQTRQESRIPHLLGSTSPLEKKSKLDPATQSDLDHSASLVFMYISSSFFLIIPPLESLFHLLTLLLSPCWYYWPCKVAPYQNVLPAIHPRLDLYSDDDPSTTTSLSLFSLSHIRVFFDFYTVQGRQQQQRTAAPIFLSIADETSRLMSIRPTSVFLCVCPLFLVTFINRPSEPCQRFFLFCQCRPTAKKKKIENKEEEAFYVYFVVIVVVPLNF